MIMYNLIGPYQSSFQQKRQGTDNGIIIQEVISHFQKMKGKKPNMIIKVDLEKAFDTLEWFFISETLFYFRMPTSLINLIMSCIASSRVAILVNGDRTDYFERTRGIRQGDPISPIYFYLVYENAISRNQTEVRNRK